MHLPALLRRFGGPHINTGGLPWAKALVDWMAAHKMNFGVVVSQFYDVVPGLIANVSEAAEIQAQLQELQLYMQERHIEFVPTLGSGSGGGPEYFNPATAEGKWVRNVSFTFGASDEAAPAA